jgi:uncharacterized protein (DUF1330 family)
MPAYMIITADISDRSKFIAGYGRAAADLVTHFGGKYVLRAPGAELIEGDFGKGASIVISEWADKEAAMRFWNSPEYAHIKKMRDGLANCQILLVEGELS